MNGMNMKYPFVKSSLCFLLIFASLQAWSQTPPFYGCLDGWTDVKRTYSAKGDGKTDDTQALQQALDELGISGHSPVLFLPKGIYRITRTLTFKSRKGIAVFGENPLNTVVRWDGAPNQPMLYLNGVGYSEYGRLTWDGNGTASAAYAHQWDQKIPFANSGTQHADEIFTNMATGILSGKNMDAEFSIRRCRFYNCTAAGISLQGPNALDWWIWDCYFEKCFTGVANNHPDFGAGNFHVYRSIFIRSAKADISLGNSNYFSFRNNVSWQSTCFLNAQQFSNSSPITLQKNWVFSDGRQPTLELFTKGNVLLLDNTFITPDTSRQPVIHQVNGFKGTTPDITLVGNRFSAQKNILEQNGGRVIDIDSKYGLKFRISNKLQPVPFAPVQRMTIREIYPKTPFDSIQYWIQKAQVTRRPVVLHFHAGEYALDQSIVIPANTPVVLLGDGFQTVLSLKKKNAPSASAIIQIASPSRAILRNFKMNGQENSSGILVNDNDEAGNLIYSNQLLLYGGKENNLKVTGVRNSRLRMENFQHNYCRNGQSVSVTGGVNVPGSLLRLFGVAGVDNQNSYSIGDRGRILVYDSWFEGVVDQFVTIKGKGELYINGTKIAATKKGNGAFIRIDSLQGKMVVAQAIFNSPGKSIFYNNGMSADSLLILGALTWNQQDNTFLNIRNRGAQQFVFLNNRANPGQGSFALENLGNTKPAFLLALLATIRATDVAADLPMKNKSWLQLERVMIEGGRIGLEIQGR